MTPAYFYSSHLNHGVIVTFVPTRAVIKGNGGAIVSNQKNSRSNLIVFACIVMLEIPGLTLKSKKDVGRRSPMEVEGPSWDDIRLWGYQLGTLKGLKIMI